MFHNKSSKVEELVQSIVWSVSNWDSPDKDFQGVSLHDLTLSWDDCPWRWTFRHILLSRMRRMICWLSKGFGVVFLGCAFHCFFASVFVERLVGIVGGIGIFASVFDFLLEAVGHFSFSFFLYPLWSAACAAGGFLFPDMFRIPSRAWIPDGAGFPNGIRFPSKAQFPGRTWIPNGIRFPCKFGFPRKGEFPRREKFPFQSWFLLFSWIFFIVLFFILCADV